MEFPLAPNRPWPRLGSRIGALAVLTVFVVWGTVYFRDVPGDDLGSSYLGCRVLAGGHASHLYAYSADDFADVGDDDAWDEAATSGEFETFQHPYVQTPLWAFLLRPACGLKFRGFLHIFELAALLSFAGCLWLVARQWAPSLLNPFGMSIVLLCLWFSEPFQYSMLLMQTHIYFVLLTVASLVLAERNRPGWAGLLLACAAAVKITPVVFVLYWLLTRRYKAALSTVLWSGALVALTLATTGLPLFAVYLANLHRISDILLISYNNQSIAAWWMARFYPDQAGGFDMLPLPAWLRIGSTLLMLSLTAAGGWMDRRASPAESRRLPFGALPFGAMIVLLVATLCAPIAWTHYFIVLVVPLMLLWQHSRTMLGTPRLCLVLAIAVMVALNLYPFLRDLVTGPHKPPLMQRYEFYAEVLCLVTLATVSAIGAVRRAGAAAAVGELAVR